VSGLAADAREVLTTTVADASPEGRPLSPTPSIWPLISAFWVSVLFVGSVFDPWAVVWFSVPVAVAVIGWFWPKPGETRRALALEQKP
jgi:cytochrome c oxidase subunit I+III